MASMHTQYNSVLRVEFCQQREIPVDSKYEIRSEREELATPATAGSANVRDEKVWYFLVADDCKLLDVQWSTTGHFINYSLGTISIHRPSAEQLGMRIGGWYDIDRAAGAQAELYVTEMDIVHLLEVFSGLSKPSNPLPRSSPLHVVVIQVNSAVLSDAAAEIDSYCVVSLEKRRWHQEYYPQAPQKSHTQHSSSHPAWMWSCCILVNASWKHIARVEVFQNQLFGDVSLGHVSLEVQPHDHGGGTYVLDEVTSRTIDMTWTRICLDEAFASPPELPQLASADAVEVKNEPIEFDVNKFYALRAALGGYVHLVSKSSLGIDGDFVDDRLRIDRDFVDDRPFVFRFANCGSDQYAVRDCLGRYVNVDEHGLVTFSHQQCGFLLVSQPAGSVAFRTGINYLTVCNNGSVLGKLGSGQSVHMHFFVEEKASPDAIVNGKVYTMQTVHQTYLRAVLADVGSVSHGGVMAIRECEFSFEEHSEGVFRIFDCFGRNLTVAASGQFEFQAESPALFAVEVHNDEGYSTIRSVETGRVLKAVANDTCVTGDTGNEEWSHMVIRVKKERERGNCFRLQTAQKTWIAADWDRYVHVRRSTGNDLLFSLQAVTTPAEQELVMIRDFDGNCMNHDFGRANEANEDCLWEPVRVGANTVRFRVFRGERFLCPIGDCSLCQGSEQSSITFCIEPADPVDEQVGFWGLQDGVAYAIRADCGHYVKRVEGGYVEDCAKEDERDTFRVGLVGSTLYMKTVDGDTFISGDNRHDVRQHSLWNRYIPRSADNGQSFTLQNFYLGTFLSPRGCVEKSTRFSFEPLERQHSEQAHEVDEKKVEVSDVKKVS